jgi:hypothetical protein
MNTMNLSNSKYIRQKTYVRVENSKNKTEQNNLKTPKVYMFWAQKLQYCHYARAKSIPPLDS